MLLGRGSGVDRERQRVQLADGELPYDTLVVATSARHAGFGRDEWEPSAPGLETLKDAATIHLRPLLAFEQVERETDPERMGASMAVVSVVRCNGRRGGKSEYRQDLEHGRAPGPWPRRRQMRADHSRLDGTGRREESGDIVEFPIARARAEVDLLEKTIPADPNGPDGHVGALLANEPVREHAYATSGGDELEHQLARLDRNARARAASGRDQEVCVDVEAIDRDRDGE
jgi:hypothetical protein